MKGSDGFDPQIQQIIVDAIPDSSVLADVGIWIGIITGGLVILGAVYTAAKWWINLRHELKELREDREGHEKLKRLRQETLRKTRKKKL